MKRTSNTKKKHSLGRLKGMWKHPKTGTWYFSPMRNGDRKNINLETKDEGEAIKKAIEANEQPEALGFPNEMEREIQDYIADKFENKKHSRFTAPHRLSLLEQFSDWADCSIKAVTKKKAHEYYLWQKTRVSSRTGKVLKDVTVQSYIISAISPFFEWLVVKRKVITKNPFSGLEMARFDASLKVKTIFCGAELRDFLLTESRNIPPDVLPPRTARWIAFALHLGFEAGLRRNEIIECRPDWINLQNGTINVKATDTFQPKTRHKRTIPMTKVLSAFLADFLAEEKKAIETETEQCIADDKKPPEFLWCIAPTVQRGKSKYRYDFLRPYNTLIKYAGDKRKEDLSWVTPHVMRHTFASLLASAGVSLYKIARWLGDTLQTTERHYAHLQASDSDIDATRKE